MFKCMYCYNTFKTRYILERHQNNTKYCLEIQAIGAKNEKKSEKKVIPKNYTCQYCNTELSSKQRLQLHYSTCIEYQVHTRNTEVLTEYRVRLEEVSNNYNKQLADKDKQIESREIQIADLQQQVKELASLAIKRPTTSNRTNNNTQIILQNMEPLTDDHLKKCVGKLTLEHIKKGPSGYAKYAAEYPFKDKVICTDISRKILKYKNEDGEIITDNDQLCDRLLSAIRKRNRKLIKREMKRIGKDFDPMHTNLRTQQKIFKLIDEAAKYSYREQDIEDLEWKKDLVLALARLLK